jgi:hypothetical protein
MKIFYPRKLMPDSSNTSTHMEAIKVGRGLNMGMRQHLLSMITVARYCYLASTLISPRHSSEFPYSVRLNGHAV